MATFVDYVPEGEVSKVSRDKVFHDFVPEDKPVKHEVVTPVEELPQEPVEEPKKEVKGKKAKK